MIIKMARMNYVFCGLHLIHNLDVAAEAAVKQSAEIASLNKIHYGFNTKNSCACDLLYEISNLCTYAHRNQHS